MKDEQNFIRQIVKNKNPKFIYGYNGEVRAKFLKRLASSFPVITDAKNKIGIGVYIEGRSLPITNQNLNPIVNTFYSQTYLNLLIIYNILNTLIEQIDSKNLESRSKSFLKEINTKINLPLHINSLNKLRDTFKKDLDNVYEKYCDYLTKGESALDEVPCLIPTEYSLLEIYLSLLLKMLNTNAYFILIFDQQEKFSDETKKEIINLTTSEIIEYISINIACEPNEWQTFEEDLKYNEAISSFTTIEIDDCFKDTKGKAKTLNI